MSCTYHSSFTTSPTAAAVLRRTPTRAPGLVQIANTSSLFMSGSRIVQVLDHDAFDTLCWSLVPPDHAGLLRRARMVAELRDRLHLHLDIVELTERAHGAVLWAVCRHETMPSAYAVGVDMAGVVVAIAAPLASSPAVSKEDVERTRSRAEEAWSKASGAA